MWQYNYTDELYHFGVKGMKWGVRRYQNKDGTLTNAGRKRYIDYNTGELTKAGKKRLTKVGQDSDEGKYIRREKMNADVNKNWLDSYNKAADYFNKKIVDINKKYGNKATIDNKKYVKEVGKLWTDSYSKQLISRFGEDPVTKGTEWVKNAPFMDDFDRIA